MQHVENLRQHATPVRALLGQMANGFEQGARIAIDQRGEHVVDLAVIQCPEHGPHIGRQHLAFAERDSLVGQTHGVTHRAIGGATEQP